MAKVGSETLGADADVPDAATGLTPRHRATIRHTWGMVKTDISTHGKGLFLAMFKTQPKLQAHFKALAGLSEAELKASPKLEEHATKVLNGITDLVDNLENTSVLVDKLKEHGRVHKARGIPTDEFDLLTPILVDYLKSKLGADVMDSIAVDAWNSTMKVINQTMISAY